MNREEMIEKILNRMTRMDYTAEHKKISENYAQPYNDALVWVLDVCLDFQMPTGTIDDPIHQSSKPTARNKFKARFFPFFKYNTQEDLKKRAKSLIGCSICIHNWFPIEIGEIINAYVEDEKIMYEVKLYPRIPDTKVNKDG